MRNNMEKSPKSEKYGTVCSAEVRKESRRFRDAFIPCPPAVYLLEKSRLAANNALSGDVMLFSPACSSFDQIRENQGAEKVYSRVARALAPTISGGKTKSHHHMQTMDKTRQSAGSIFENILRLAPGFFEEKPRRKITTQNIPHHERTLKSANINE